MGTCDLEDGDALDDLVEDIANKLLIRIASDVLNGRHREGGESTEDSWSNIEVLG